MSIWLELLAVFGPSVLLLGIFGCIVTRDRRDDRIRAKYRSIRDLEWELQIGEYRHFVSYSDGRKVLRIDRTPYPLLFVNDNCRAAKIARRTIGAS